MKRSTILFALATLSLSPALEAATAPRNPSENRAIDLAICLDISGSMSDLLDSVRGRVWDILAGQATPRMRRNIAADP